ncbi:hypothetical protein SRABI106_04435 [Rahnella aquatilis]|nr:hypothetical protein SRABI106_04435 [Rahnella aquatilis]
MRDTKAAFEKWIAEERPKLFLDYMSTTKPPQYADPATERLWQAWTASRAAIEIELKQFDDFQLVHYGTTEDYAKGYIDAQNNANKAITSHGIRIKGKTE